MNGASNETKETLTDHVFSSTFPTKGGGGLCSQTLEKDTQFSLYLCPPPIHLPPAGGAAENRDCTVARRRAALTGSNNESSLFVLENLIETYRTVHVGGGRLSFTPLPS